MLFTAKSIFRFLEKQEKKLAPNQNEIIINVGFSVKLSFPNSEIV